MLVVGDVEQRTPALLRPMTRVSPTLIRISLAWSVTSISCSPLMGREAGDDRAVALEIVDIGDALAAAVGAAIFVGRAALAVAVGADGEDELLGRRELGHPLGRERRLRARLPSTARRADSRRAPRWSRRSRCRIDSEMTSSSPFRRDAAHAGRGAALELAHVGRREADRLALAGGEQDVVAPRSAARRRSAGPSRPPRSASRTCRSSGMLAKASIELRRTPPLAVAKTTWSLPHSASSSGSGSTVEIVSPSASGSRLTIGRPRVCGAPSGRRQTLRR